MYRLTVEGRPAIALDPAKVYVAGRSPEGELSCVADTSMSRIQGELFWNGTTWVLRNKSQHGSFVGTRRVDAECPLVPGDVLRLGSTKLLFERDPAAATVASPSSGAAPATPGGAPDGAGYDENGQFHMGFTMMAAPGQLDAARPNATAQQLVGARARNRNLLFFGVVFVVALLGCCCLTFMFLLPAAAGAPGSLLVGTIVGLLPAVPYLALYKVLDRNGQIPWKNFLACFFWGAAVGCGFSIVLNTVTGSLVFSMAGQEAASLVTPVVLAPFFEESTKGLAVLVVFFVLRDEFDNAVEGMLLGAASGLGFAVVENVVYDTRFFISGGFGTVALMGTFRTLTCALVGHPVYTAMTGLGLGLSREWAHSPVRFVTPIAGWAMAVFMHGTWNLAATVLMPTVFKDNELVGLIAMAVVIGGACASFFFGVLVVSLIRERRVLVKYLSDEVQKGFIEPLELAGFQSLFGREKFVFGGLRQGTYKLRKELRRAQLELAFRKWHLDQGDEKRGTAAIDLDLLDARTRIRDARNALNEREGRKRGPTA